MIRSNLYGNIVINRGDTVTIPFEIYEEVSEGTNLYFGVMEYNKPFEFGIIRKKYSYSDIDSDNTLNVVLDSTDTLFLEPGTYFYSLKMETVEVDSNTEEEHSTVTTLVPRTKFIILQS